MITICLINDNNFAYPCVVFIISYPKANAQALAGEYPLLEPSFSIPEETAPLLVQFGKISDVRQGAMQIPQITSVISS
jgi:hypothetical protein